MPIHSLFCPPTPSRGRRSATGRAHVRARAFAGAALVAGMALSAGAPGAFAAVPAGATFTYTGGEQSYTVPAGVGEVQITAVGGPGGSGQQSLGPGGRGGQVSGVLGVSAGKVLYVEVGGAGHDATAVTGALGTGGFSGGGSAPAYGGGGGGASDVRTVSCAATGCPGDAPSLASRLLIAAGGGGSGDLGGAGSDAGAAGAAGPNGSLNSGGGGGAAGGPAAGGDAGTPGSNPSGICLLLSVSGGGVLGSGGNAESGRLIFPGGGGGGGLYGGGAGGAACVDGANGAGGGGGGSSFVAAALANPSIGIAGTGTAPSVTITPVDPAVQPTPTSLTFPAQAQSTLGVPQTVTISNTGNAPLSLSGLSFTGANPGDFLIGSSTCSGAIAPRASCQVTVWFAPQAQGTRSATLDIASNDPSGPATLAVSGTGSPLAQGPTVAIGPQGPAGSQGPQGPAGPQGPQGIRGPAGPAGPAGTIVCRTTPSPRAQCALEFAPGSHSIQRSIRTAHFQIQRRRRTIAHGTIPVHAGRTTVRSLGTLSPGRYTLTITTGHGRHAKSLLHRLITIR